MILITYIGASYDTTYAFFQHKKAAISINTEKNRFSKVIYFIEIGFFSLLNPVYK